MDKLDPARYIDSTDFVMDKNSDLTYFRVLSVEHIDTPRFPHVRFVKLWLDTKHLENPNANFLIRGIRGTVVATGRAMAVCFWNNQLWITSVYGSHTQATTFPHLGGKSETTIQLFRQLSMFPTYPVVPPGVCPVADW